MMVTSYVELTVPAQERHLKVARAAAEWLTTDKSSVTVEVPVDAPKMIVTTFPIARARQNDVADRIMRAFAMDMGTIRRKASVSRNRKPSSVAISASWNVRKSGGANVVRRARPKRERIGWGRTSHMAWTMHRSRSNS